MKIENVYRVNCMAERIVNICKYRRYSFDIVMCKLKSRPCVATVDSGKCPILIEYFKEKNIESE